MYFIFIVFSVFIPLSICGILPVHHEPEYQPKKYDDSHAEVWSYDTGPAKKSYTHDDYHHQPETQHIQPLYPTNHYEAPVNHYDQHDQVSYQPNHEYKEAPHSNYEQEHNEYAPYQQGGHEEETPYEKEGDEHDGDGYENNDQHDNEDAFDLKEFDIDLKKKAK